jgi:hypothetical protein
VWTRGRDPAQPGKFAFTLYSEGAQIAHVGGFDSAGACDRAAERAQREALRGTLPQALTPVSAELAALTADELAAELDDHE